LIGSKALFSTLLSGILAFGVHFPLRLFRTSTCPVAE
jgi:hypothetical protein